MYKKDFQYLKKFSKRKRTFKKPARFNEDTFDLQSFWENYCAHTSVHGIKYIADKNLHKFEKILWAIIVILSFFGMAYVSLLVSFEFFNSPIHTDIETASYPVSEIPFPAVTICNRNLINWKRIDEAVKKFLPLNATKDVINLFKKFISKFEGLQYGNFEVYKEFDNVSLESLDNIDLHLVAKFMMHKCEEIFLEKCWWRNRFYNCCEIFVRQFSELGICYAFNSVVNSVGRKKLKTTSDWPWRTSNYGPSTGLRLKLRIDPKAYHPETELYLGATVAIHNPEEWPQPGGKYISVGTRASLSITPKYIYAHDATHKIPPDMRLCLFQDEATELSKVWGLPYSKSNCMSQCRQQYLVLYCNCTIKFLYPLGNYTQCTASDFNCLSKYQHIFTNDKSMISNQHLESNEEGITCSCLLECHSVSYKLDMSSFQMAKDDAHNISLDIHYKYATMNKYKVDVIYQWEDLLVAFGGIASLFIGSSLISIFEIFYYLTICFGTYFAIKYRKMLTIISRRNPTKTKKIKVRIYEDPTLLSRNKIVVENNKF